MSNWGYEGYQSITSLIIHPSINRDIRIILDDSDNIELLKQYGNGKISVTKINLVGDDGILTDIRKADTSKMGTGDRLILECQILHPNLGYRTIRCKSTPLISNYGICALRFEPDIENKIKLVCGF
jgi:hypothetical protein